MTIDTVVQKTGLTLGVVVLVAAATWFLTGDITDAETPAERPLRHLGGRRPRRLRAGDGQLLQEGDQPRAGARLRRLPGRLRRCLQQGVETIFARTATAPGGLVIGAVLGTMAAVAGTLAAYKFFNIKVGSRFHKWVIAAGIGLRRRHPARLGARLLRRQLGFNGFGPLGLLMSVIGLGLGVLFLILDFD